MTRFDWLKTLTRGRRLRRNLQRRSRTRQASSVAATEALEDRLLLTLWTVTTLDDVVDANDGELSLREAVEAAFRNEEFNDARPGGEADQLDTIRFDGSLFDNGPAEFRVSGSGANSGPIELHDESAVRGGPLSIVGPGRDANGDWLLQFDGSESGSIFSVAGTVSLSGIELRDSTSSAIVTIVPDLSITDAAFRNNRGDSGAAIRIATPQSPSFVELNVESTLFEGNEASNDGGAVATDLRNGQVTFRNSVFLNNTAGDRGGAFRAEGAQVLLLDSRLEDNSAGSNGGGALSLEGAQVEVHDTTLTGNTTPGDGGAIWSDGTLVVGNSMVARNAAGGQGGGIRSENILTQTAGSLTVTETAITENTATTGGGISSEFRAAAIERSEFSGNVASDSGGAIAFSGDFSTSTVVNTTISGNYANRHGGGILRDAESESDGGNAGRLVLTNNTIVLNRADADGNGVGLGGGIAVTNLPSGQTISNTQLFNTIVAGNLVGQNGVETTDNGDAAYVENGVWDDTSSGYNGSARLVNGGDGSQSASWTFSDLEPGEYRVLVTWQQGNARATDAPFSVKDGQRILQTIAVDQTKQPLPHAVDANSNFESLGGYTITGGTLVVELTNAANGQVVADAVRIERVDDGSDIGPLVNAYDIHVADAGATVNVDRSWHNLIGDPKSSAGIPDDPEDLENNNFVGNAGNQWSVDRIIFRELSDNLGGATRVHAIKADSPAIDEGSPFLLSATDGIPYDDDGNPFVPQTNLIISDQRGYPFLRSDDQAGTQAGDFPVDIGAYELQLAPLLRAEEIVVSNSGIEVDGNFADGELTYLEAIQIANLRTDRSTIRFSPDLLQDDGSPAVIDLRGASNASLTARWDLYISGGGTILQFGGLVVDARASVTVDDVRFEGSGIQNFGDLTLQDVEGTNVDGNAFQGLLNLGTATIRDSVFRDNDNSDADGCLGTRFATSTDCAGVIHNNGEIVIGPNVVLENNKGNLGGAIRNYGHTTIVDSQITNNESMGPGGGIFGQGESLVIRRSTISNNTSVGNGGGVFESGELVLTDTTVDGNTVNAPSSAEGGGVYFLRGLIDRSTISGNTVNANDGASFASGGGVYIEPRPGAKVIRSSTISGNRLIGLDTFGGGVFIATTFNGSDEEVAFATIESSTIALNQSNGTRRGEGGGVYVDHATVLSNTLLADNEARTDAGEDLFFTQGVDIDGPFESPVDGSTIENPVTHTLAVKPSTGSAGVFATDNPHGNLIVAAGLSSDLIENDGAFTATHPLNPTSNAIDSGFREGLLDQRGFPTTDNDLSLQRPGAGRLENGYTIDDGSGLLSADIGAYESATVVLEEFGTSVQGANQFSAGLPPVLGLGFDDGQPDSRLDADPFFLGLNFDPDPFRIGPGIATREIDLLFDTITTQWGGEAIVDVDGRFGFELGYYVNAGSVDSFFDGLFGYSIDDSAANEGKFLITTAVELTDAAVYTTSPNLGAYLDLVLELNANITGTGCFGGCFGGDLDISFDESVPLLSINAQKTDDNDNALFLDRDGRETTERAQGNRPALDGEIFFVGTDSSEFRAEIEEEELEDRLEEVGGFDGLLAQIREERREAEIERDRKRRSGEDTSQEDAIIQRSTRDEKTVNQARESEEEEIDFCRGKFITLCLGTSESVLGAEATLGVGVETGQLGLNKPLGTLQATVPEVNLSGTEPDANFRVSASTDDFVVGSEEDVAREVARLSVDVGALAPLGGRVEAEFGPLEIEATTVSYNVAPRLAIGQDVSVEPFFDANHQASFLFTPTGGDIVVTVGGNETEISSGESATVSFMPGQNVQVDADPDNNGTAEVDVTPSIKVGQRFSNKFALEFDVIGILEALAIDVTLFDNSLFSAGPLFEQTHALLEGVDLFDIWNTTFDLPATTETLSTFSLGGDQGSSRDGETPGNAIPLEPGTPTTDLDSIAADEERYFSIGLIDNGGQFRTDVRFETDGAVPQRVRPPYEGLTLELINVDGGEDVVVSSFPIDIGGQDLAGFTSWDGEVWRLKGFEDLSGSQAIFGATFNTRPTSVTATPQGGPDLANVGERTRTADEQNAIVRQAIPSFVDNDLAFDVDGDGFVSPTTDGEIVVRFMRGETGEDLIQNAVASGATRRTAEEIQAYLQGLKDPRGSEPGGNPTEAELQAFAQGNRFGRRLDVDDSATFDQSGQLVDDGVDPDIDGVLILRYLSGIGITAGTGPALTFGESTGNALPEGRREAPQDIATYIAIGDLEPPRLQTSAADVNRSSVRQAITRDDLFEVFPDAVSGSSPWTPIYADFENGSAAFTLDTYRDEVRFDEVYVVPESGDEILVRTNAVGTPTRTLPVPEALVGQLSNPDPDALEFRGETEERALGFQIDAPLFVQLPNATGYRLQLQQSNLAITHLVFDRGVGGNVHRDHTRDDADPQVDFDVYLPDSDQWFTISMADGSLELPAGVRDLELYPRDLVNPDLFNVQTDGEIDLDLPVGLVLSGPQTSAPVLNVVVLADQQGEVGVDPIFAQIAGVANDDADENVVRLTRNGAWLDVTANGAPVPLISRDGLDLTISDDRGSRILDNSEAGFSVISGNWQTVNSEDAIDGSYRRKSAGNGSAIVSWTFDNVPDDEALEFDDFYLVAVSWVADPSNATAAKYTVRSGDFEGTFEVDQTQAPAGLDGFELLGLEIDPLTPFGDTITIELSDDAQSGQFVVADAVRIERAQSSNISFTAVPSIIQINTDGIDTNSDGLDVRYGFSNVRTVTITDEQGRTATDTFRIQPAFSAGPAPSFIQNVSQPIADIVVPIETTVRTVDLQDVFRLDGNVAYEVATDNPLVTPSVSGTTLTLNIASGTDTAVVSIYAEATINGSFSDSSWDTFRITIDDAPAGGPVVLNPITDLMGIIPFGSTATDQIDIETLGRYSNGVEIPLAAAAPYRAENIPEIQSRSIQVSAPASATTSSAPTTLILDGTNGPLYQPISFVGSGFRTDRLQVDGGGIELDLANRDYVANIGFIDLRGEGENKLSVDAASVLPFGSRLIVLADPGVAGGQDTVERVDESEWTLDRSNATDGDFPGVVFDVYQATVELEDAPNRDVELWVSNTVDAANHPAGPAPQDRDRSTLTRDLTPENDPVQFVSTSAESLLVQPNTTFTVDVEYRVAGSSGEGPPAILIEAHFDSDRVAFERVVNVEGAGDFVPALLANNAEIAELISDNDINTDSVVVLSWNDIRGVNGNDWPNNASSETRVITLQFTTKATEGDTSINFTGEASADFALATRGLNLTVDPDVEDRIVLDNGTLTITGTDATDSVAVTESDGQLVVTATFDGDERQRSFEIDDVDNIVVDAAGGDDFVRLSSIAIPATITGGTGDDELRGAAGNDSIIGGEGADSIVGGGGNDTVVGNAGNDTLRGGEGDDVITDMSGDNSIRGETGDDTIMTGDGDDFIRAQGGDDVVDAGGGSNDVRGAGGDDTITTGAGNDTVVGGSQNDVLDSGAGDDEVRGGNNGDLITSGEGNDTVVAGRGRDTVFGGTGDDLLQGNNGDDFLIGGEGNDTLGGNRDTDVSIGGPGSDTLNSGGFDDLLIGGTTDFDSIDSLSAIAAIHSEWTASRSYTRRVANLRDGSGSDNRENGDHFLVANDNVHDDGASDLLTGGTLVDWYFARLGMEDIADQIDGLEEDEIIDELF